MSVRRMTYASRRTRMRFAAFELKSMLLELSVLGKQRLSGPVWCVMPQSRPYDRLDRALGTSQTTAEPRNTVGLRILDWITAQVAAVDVGGAASLRKGLKYTLVILNKDTGARSSEAQSCRVAPMIPSCWRTVLSRRAAFRRMSYRALWRRLGPPGELGIRVAITLPLLTRLAHSAVLQMLPLVLGLGEYLLL
jgi:hypothetical protein